MKTFKIFSMAAVALCLAACSNSDDYSVQMPTQSADVLHFEATIAAPDADATMRTVYTEVTESSDPDYKKIKVAWKAGDKIALVHNGKKDVAEVKTVDGSGKATIEATITGSPSDNDDVYLAYPADAVYSATPYSSFPFTPNSTTFDKVKSQDGTLEFIQNNLDLRMGSGKLAVSGDKVTLKESVSVSSLICIWKLTLQDNASTPLNATQLTFKNNTFIQAKATSTAKSVYYLCVVPSFIPDASGTFSFEATVGSDTYTFSKTGLSLTAGKYYQSTLTMAKALAYPVALSAVTADYVGSVVTSDGNVYAKVSDATTAGKTAVAMIAYVGSGKGYLTYTHGLAISLADEASEMDWNTAKSTCEGKSAVTNAKWLLPSQIQWKAMFSANGGNEGKYTGLNTALATAGGDSSKLTEYYDYWSSTQKDGDNFWYVTPQGGDAAWNSDSKGNNHQVRACLAF